MQSKHVADIETLRAAFVMVFKNRNTGEFRNFEISEFKNELYDLLKFYTPENIKACIGYNYLAFDAQVMEFIIESSESWGNHTGLEICESIYKFVQNLIELRQYDGFLPYRSFKVPVIDCFTILGLDNQARLTSLKALEFALDMPSVETMPIHHSTAYLSVKDIYDVKKYCKTDVDATDKVYDLILGNTDHPLHKGVNLIELRETIKAEYGLDCLNFSDIKLGDELMKLSYAKAIKKQIKDLPKKGTYRKAVKLGDCLPSYISFKTPKLQKLLAKIKKTSIGYGDKWEETVVIGKTTHIQALGGLHSVNDNEVYKATDRFKIVTSDVSSMYPASIVNNNYFPAHLGKELLITYKDKYEERIRLKPQAKADARIRGIVEALKLMLNACFGKMGSSDSWLFDKKTMYSVTLTGQYAILMLIETLEMAGFSVICSNTDGIETYVPVSKEEDFYKICKDWEDLTKYQLEHDEYSAIYMQNINNYLAITVDGKVKKKGDSFMTDFNLWKDKSMRIRGLALEQYFVKGIRPEDFIPNHKNIFDFCIRAKANRGAEIVLRYGDGHQDVLGSMVRYYYAVGHERPEIFKHFIEKGKYNNEAAENDLGKKRVCEFNRYEDRKDYYIDYNQYIYETYRVIAGIEGNNKDKSFVDSIIRKNQFKLF